jgi:hypothetical protein
MKHLLFAAIAVMLVFAAVGAAIFGTWAGFFGCGMAGAGAVIACVLLTPLD